MDITVVDLEDETWNARRVELQGKILEAIEVLVEHMGGGIPVEFPATINGHLYTVHMDRVKSDRKIN